MDTQSNEKAGGIRIGSFFSLGAFFLFTNSMKNWKHLKLSCWHTHSELIAKITEQIPGGEPVTQTLEASHNSSEKFSSNRHSFTTEKVKANGLPS